MALLDSDSTMVEPLATVAIQSIGDMGVGIARLLMAHNFRVITNAAGRSATTQQRARDNNIVLVRNDIELCDQADYIMSIVPQKDALSVANRVIAATNSSAASKRTHPLFFLDLNAVSPRTARSTAELFSKSAPSVKLIDGGIISGPPRLKDDGSWQKPRLVVSGPVKIEEGLHGEELARVVNIQHIDDTVGSASALKMCFAAMNKGFAAIAIQSFTTAQRFGVVENLQDLLTEYNPGFAQAANRLLPGMPPRAYRWVQEMIEISDTFEIDGHFAPRESIFRPVSELYRLVADETELGKEQTEDRKCGQTAEDVAALMARGIDERSR